MTIREAQPDDAQSLINMFHTLDNETRFMMFEPGERQLSLENQQKRLKAFQSQTQETMLLGLIESKIVGFIVGSGGRFKRNKHSLFIVLGVLQAYTGRGVGKKLMQSLETWAKDNDFHRLELTVMKHNNRAKGLYEYCGFEYEGIKRDSLFVDGCYVDELYMSKLI